RVSDQIDLHQQNVAIGIRSQAQGKAEALMGVNDFHGRGAGRQQPQTVVLQPLDLCPETEVIGHDEAKVANLWNVDTRIVDFVDNAEAEREPDARRAEGAAHNVLGAAGPCWRDAGTAWRLSKGLV